MELFQEGLLITQDDNDILKCSLHCGRIQESNYVQEQMDLEHIRDAWLIVGEEVINAVTDTLHGGRILKELNNTILIVVPKTKCPHKVIEFRHIACCHIVYKCITKVILGRLRQVLPDFVMEN